MKPYYKDKWVSIFNADCRQILPGLDLEDALITDPVWPNTAVDLVGKERPYELLSEMCKALPAGVQRLVIHLGCDSDPRFLSAVPSSWPFLRLCQLKYTIPHYKGRVLYDADIAYVFGRPPLYIPGRQLMTGGCQSSVSDRQNQRHSGKHRRRTMNHSPEDGLIHPTPRRLQHVRWLVAQFSDTQVVDPFMGSGTTMLAAKQLNRQAIGIEIEEKFCEAAANRLSQEVLDLSEATI
jgi:site-specific DNA-methyltransferase (adenine-specific)